MAKGDHKRVETEINKQGKIGDQRNTQTYNTIAGSNQQYGQNYNQAAGMQLGDYGNIMGKYNDIYNNPFGPGAEGSSGGSGGGGIGGGGLMDMYSNLAMNGGGYGWDPEWRGGVSKSLGTFGEFADTGGFSEQGIQDMRARAIAPTRAVYQNALSKAKQGQALTGGSPNFNATLSRMARDNAYAIGDMNVNANAEIAKMVQQGRLAGAQGLGQVGLGAQGASTNIDELNARMKLAGLSGMQSVQGANAASGAARDSEMLDARMAALSGMRGMYGTNPALLQVTGDQNLNSERNLLGASELSNNFGMGQVNNRLSNSQVPGNFQSAMGNVGSVANLAGGLINPLGSLFGGGFGGNPLAYGGGMQGGTAYGGASTAPWERRY